MREVFHEVERLSLFFTHARAFRLSYSSLNKKTWLPVCLPYVTGSGGVWFSYAVSPILEALAYSRRRPIGLTETLSMRIILMTLTPN